MPQNRGCQARRTPGAVHARENWGCTALLVPPVPGHVRRKPSAGLSPVFSPRECPSVSDRRRPKSPPHSSPIHPANHLASYPPSGPADDSAGYCVSDRPNDGAGGCEGRGPGNSASHALSHLQNRRADCGPNRPENCGQSRPQGSFPGDFGDDPPNCPPGDPQYDPHRHPNRL